MINKTKDVGTNPKYPQPSSINHGKKRIRDVKINKFNINILAIIIFKREMIVIFFNLITPQNLIYLRFLLLHQSKIT